MCKSSVHPALVFHGRMSRMISVSQLTLTHPRQSWAQLQNIWNQRFWDQLREHNLNISWYGTFRYLDVSDAYYIHRSRILRYMECYLSWSNCILTVIQSAADYLSQRFRVVPDACIWPGVWDQLLVPFYAPCAPSFVEPSCIGVLQFNIRERAWKSIHGAGKWCILSHLTACQSLCR